VSATDLAEYAYCPRAFHYRREYPNAPATPEALEGRAYHLRVLGAERRRDAGRGSSWIALLLGGVLVVLGLAWGFAR
jgi:hypothetical protein